MVMCECVLDNLLNVISKINIVIEKRCIMLCLIYFQMIVVFECILNNLNIKIKVSYIINKQLLYR